MDLKGFKHKLNEAELAFQEQVPLVTLTTFKIGGPADILLDIKQKDQLITVLKAAKEFLVPVTILGWGSNILISDSGIRGVVIRLKTNGIRTLSANKRPETFALQEEMESAQKEARLIQAEPDTYYSFADLDYDETDKPQIQVEIDSGVSLQYAINYLIDKGITGLQWFSGIPGTIGGAIYNNIHGGKHFLFEYLAAVEVVDLTGKNYQINAAEIESGYDYSRFHTSQEIILSGTFNLYLGDKGRAKATSIEWARRKKLQPRNSAGCTFQNLTVEQSKALNFKSNGFGYVIDKILKLKGKQIGGAKISEKHAAFIENSGNANAKDVLQLIRLINKASLEKIGIKPKLEIFLLGFSPKEIKDLI